MSDLLLVWARGFHFGGGMILVGVVAFRWLVLLPAFAREGDETWQKLAPFIGRLNWLFLTATVILILSGIAWFWAVAAGMSGTSLTESLSPDTLGTVFFQTQFGTVCQWRLGFLAIFLLLLAKLTWDRWLLRRRISPIEIIGGWLAAAMVVSIAWTGHAAASGGPHFPWRIMADATHLFAASIWPTGLLPFALFLGCASRIDDFSRLRPVLVTANRFSNVSLVVVGILAASGIINTCFIVGSLRALVTTDYGRLLCLKIFLFFLILVVAAWNRYRLVPRLFAEAASPGRKPVLPVLLQLHRFVLIEFALAVAVIAVVSILGTSPPPG